MLKKYLLLKKFILVIFIKKIFIKIINQFDQPHLIKLFSFMIIFFYQKFIIHLKI